MVYLTPKEIQEVVKSMPPFKGVRGSIVRVKICDFMTYKLVEMRAGAHVNLVMGPNGTGKSTIVCAICLGLAGKPKVLGRALALKQYIRHGCKSAWVEIELYNDKGKNFIIRRDIKETNTGASSEWFLNGSSTSLNNIENLMTNLNIQLDNLCQFLPQDRVQEFARMDNYSRLMSTEKAVAAEDLASKHLQLIDLTHIVRRLEHSLQAASESVKTEMQYNQRIETQVNSYNEREKLKEQIAELTGKKSWIIYLKSVHEFSEVKRQQKELMDQKKVEENKIAPLKKCVEKMDSKLVKYKQELSQIRTNNMNINKKAKRKFEEDCERVEGKVTEINSEIYAQERTEKDRMKRVYTCRAKISGLENELEEMKNRGDGEDQSARLQELEYRKKKLYEQFYEISGLNEQDDNERRNLKTRIAGAEMDLKKFDDVRVSRLRYLRRENPDVYSAIEYFSKPENKTRFRGQIYEPMVMHVSVNNMRFGKMVERHIGSETFAFFCEDKYDLKTFLDITKSLNLRVSILHFNMGEKFVRPKNPYPSDFMKKFGFERILMDLIEAPEYYLAYICQRFRPQMVPIGTKKTDTMLGQIQESTQLKQFYTDESAFNITESEYSGKRCVTITYLRPARIFTDEINANEKDKLLESVKALKAEIAEYEKRVQSRAPKLQDLNSEMQEIDRETQNIQSKKEHFKQVESKLLNARKSIEMLESEKIDIEALKKEANEQILAERMKLLDSAEWLADKLSEISRSGSKLVVIKRQVSELQTRLDTKKTEQADAEVTIREITAQLNTVKEQVRLASETADINKRAAIKDSNMNEPPKDVKDGEITESEVTSQLNAATVQLGFLPDMDPAIIKDYQERLKKIEELGRSKQMKESELAAKKAEIVKLKEEWIVPLQELIHRINSNFGRFFAAMKCAGEVSLVEGKDPDDFSQYGIRINVKFRSSEELSELSGFHQSGGERAVTTAMYVLALQELTTVPFRVMDEINQGMDPKNEARVFNLLCDLARGDNTPQYFLLTPKTLPKVNYPDNVDFLFIFNGPHVKVPQLSFGTGASEEEDDNMDYDDEIDVDDDD